MDCMRVARNWWRSPSSSRVNVGCHSLVLSTKDAMGRDPVESPTGLIVIETPSLAAASFTLKNQVI